MFKIKNLKNFAVIEAIEDELELKDLTVFMGDNSAGKSYMAMLIHSFVTMSRGYQDKNFLKSINSKFSNHKLMINLKNIVTKIIKNNHDRLVLSFDEEDLEDLKNIIKFSINEYLFKKYLTNVLFEKQNIEEIEIELNNIHKVLPKILLITNTQKDENTTIEVSIDEKNKVVADFKGDFSKEFIITETINSIMSKLVESAVKNTLPINSVYLPASRTGYLQTYKVLSNEAVFKNYTSNKEGNKNYLSIIIRFFITQLNTNTGFTDNEFSKYIENFIMNGKVNIYKDNNNIEFELDNGNSIDLNYISSTVSELIPLVVFLKRGIIKKKGLLVIEEPEAHLSFKNQKLIAKLIALLLQNNIKVLITTHSDFLIYELNNLIMKQTVLNNKDKLKDNIDEEILEDNIAIDHRKIGLYNFILKNSQSTIKKVDIDKYGIKNKYIFDNTYSITSEKNRFLELLDLIDG